jgi:hypothetical protein
MIRIAAIFLALVLAVPAVADDYESRTLLQQGDWVVELIHDTGDGTLWCTASTFNRASQRLGISTFDNGALSVHVMDRSWSLRERDVRFHIQIDRTRWSVNGTASGIGVSVFPDNSSDAARFIEDLAAGYSVVLLNDELRKLADFSLRGSRAALNELMSCWQSISARDPFETGSDPF